MVAIFGKLSTKNKERILNKKNSQLRNKLEKKCQKASVWMKNGEIILYGNIETDLILVTPSLEK
jgi:hypothetical protein